MDCCIFRSTVWPKHVAVHCVYEIILIWIWFFLGDVCTYLRTYLLTHSIQQSPSWEANWFCSYSRNSPHFMEPEGSYRIHKCPPPGPILSQFDPVHAPTSYFPKIDCNIILPSTPGSSKWSLSLRFPYQNPVYTSPLPQFSRHYCIYTALMHGSWVIQSLLICEILPGLFARLS